MATKSLMNPVKSPLTFTAPTLTAGNVIRLTLQLKQDATGSRTAAGWPASVLFSGGTAPTLTTTANKTDYITMDYDGTNYYLGRFEVDGTLVSDIYLNDFNQSIYPNIFEMYGMFTANGKEYGVTQNDGYIYEINWDTSGLTKVQAIDYLNSVY